MLSAIRLNAKASNHHRPNLKRLEQFERLERLEPVGIVERALAHDA
jgi:hypothetical protein